MVPKFVIEQGVWLLPSRRLLRNCRVRWDSGLARVVMAHYKIITRPYQPFAWPAWACLNESS